MKGCLLGPKNLTQNEILLLEEGKKVFEEFSYVPITSLTLEDGKVLFNGRDLSEFDFVLPRIPRTYVYFGYCVLSLLEKEVYLPIKPQALFLSHHKFLTLLASKEIVKVPKTFLTNSEEIIKKKFKKLKFPLVFKLIYGSLGKGVMFADSEESARSLVDMLKRFQEPIFMEEYVENPGEDLRVVVIGNEVFAMKRIAKAGERRANIAISGKAKKVELNEKEKELALKLAEKLGMKICGLDFIQKDGELYLIEANVNVHFLGITRATKVNIAAKMINFIKEEVKTRKSFLERLMKWLKEIREIHF